MDIAILVSDKSPGSNLKNIYNNIKNGDLKNINISAVISTSNDSTGLMFAKENNLKAYVNYNKDNLQNLLKEINPDLIVLAGWKQIITDDVINNYPNKIINLHPGLIPDKLTGYVKNPDGTKALWNKSMYQEDAIKNFLKKKSTYAGSSTHFLTEEFDFGPVIGRVFEKINPDDTIESLYKRLRTKENKLYIETLRKINNKI